MAADQPGGGLAVVRGDRAKDLLMLDPDRLPQFLHQVDEQAIAGKLVEVHVELQDFLEDLNSGHNTVATVFLQCHAMYRATGPEERKAVGETEFVADIAAMSDSGAYGNTRIYQGIVGLTLGLGCAAGSGSPCRRRRRAASWRAPFRGVRY